VVNGGGTMLGGTKVKRFATRWMPRKTSTVIKVGLYHKDALQFRARPIKKLRIDEIQQKGYRPGIYYEAEQGAVRVLEEGCVEIDCYQAA